VSSFLPAHQNYKGHSVPFMKIAAQLL